VGHLLCDVTYGEHIGIGIVVTPSDSPYRAEYLADVSKERLVELSQF